MHSLDELVRHAESDLAKRYRVDAGLGIVLETVEAARTPAEAADNAHRVVRRRIRALQAAAGELEQLRVRIAYLAAAIPFLEEGWPQRRQQLEQRLAAEPESGLAAWLRDWFSAAAWRRVAALERLHDVSGLPAGASLLLDRFRAASRALDERSWHGCHTLLEAAATGIAVGRETVPGVDVRRELRLLLVRLALCEGLPAEAERALALAEADQMSPATRALRARLHRLYGQGAETDFDIGDESGADLDVAVELISGADSREQPDVALDVARAAVDALPVLHDIDAELARIVEPPPAELWTAVADRALRDEEEELFETAALNAERAAAPTAYPLLAAIAELRASAARQANRPVSEQAGLLLNAAAHRLWSEQVDAAQTLVDKVLELEPDNVDASLVLADSLLARSRNAPLVTGAEQLRRAIELVEHANRAGQITTARSWCFLVESEARQLLAEDVGIDRLDQLWRGALAAGRSLVHEPEIPGRWVEISSAAATLQLSSVALELARRAHDLDSQDDAATAALVSGLVNVGRYDEALAAMETRSAGWFGAIRGYVAALSGDPWRAVRALRAPGVDTTPAWATQVLAGALLLAGRDAEAADEAKRALTRWLHRRNEYQGARTVALMQLILGQPDQALEALAGLPEGNAHTGSLDLRGAALMLDGDGDAGAELVRRAIELTTVPTDVREIRALLRLTAALAQRSRTAVPELGELHAAVERREAEVQTQPDALAQVAEADVGNVEVSVVEQTKAFLTAAVQIVRQDLEAATATAEVAVQAAAGDREVAMLRDWAARAPAAAVDTEPPLVPEPEPSGGGDEAPIERPIVVEMPVSWFAGIDDPVNQHPFFTEYLPTVRASAGRSVPPVNVRVSDDLEPAGFRIFLHGDLIDHGTFDPEFSYVRNDALPLLERELAGEAVPVHGTAFWRLPLPASAPLPGVASLLAMPAAEAVAWCVALSLPTPAVESPAQPATTTGGPAL